MVNCKSILKNHIENEEMMEALHVLESNFKRDNDFFLLRVILREYVFDLNSAYEDLKNYNGTNTCLKEITQARILAKLGYVDVAKSCLKNYPLINTPSCQIDSEGVPYTQGIVYTSFDMERMGFDQFIEVVDVSQDFPLFDSLLYSLLVLGAYYTLESILSNSKNDSSGYSNLIKSLKKYDELPCAEKLESNKQEIKLLIQNIRGWLSVDEGLLLQQLAGQVSNDAKVVEIGSFHGRSTTCLASAIRTKYPKIKIYSVDPHQGVFDDSNSLTHLKRNINDRELDIEYIVEESLSAEKNWSDQNIGLLFIDALHDYDNVKADFEKWSKHVLDGGYVLFHDSVQPGVNELLLEILNSNNEFEPLGLRDSIFVFQKNGCINKNKNSFFYHYLTNKGMDFNNWIERDKRNLRFFAD